MSAPIAAVPPPAKDDSMVDDLEALGARASRCHALLSLVREHSNSTVNDDEIIDCIDIAISEMRAIADEAYQAAERWSQLSTVDSSTFLSVEGA